MPTILRRLSAVPLGVFYGGSFVNGIIKGLAYVTESSGYSLSQWPAVEFSTNLVATMLMGFFSSYSSRSALIGIIASGIGASIVYFLPQETLFLPANYWSASALILSVPGTLYGRSLPLPMEDLPTGRLLGVDWKHWLWLWLPWQYVIADSVWLGTPGVHAARRRSFSFSNDNRSRKIDDVPWVLGVCDHESSQ